jgi:hypothetical protein
MFLITELECMQVGLKEVSNEHDEHFKNLVLQNKAALISVYLNCL